MKFLIQSIPVRSMPSGCMVSLFPGLPCQVFHRVALNGTVYSGFRGSMAQITPTCHLDGGLYKPPTLGDCAIYSGNHYILYIYIYIYHIVSEPFLSPPARHHALHFLKSSWFRGRHHPHEILRPNRLPLPWMILGSLAPTVGLQLSL